jgi:hypothetical protein
LEKRTGNCEEIDKVFSGHPVLLPNMQRAESIVINMLAAS